MVTKITDASQLPAPARNRNRVYWITGFLITLVSVGCSRDGARPKATEATPPETASTAAEASHSSTNAVPGRPESNAPAANEELVRAKLLAIWGSTNSLPKDRADAARKLIPVDASMDSVVALLGTEDGIDHKSGILMGTTNVVNDWILHYRSSRGSVWVRFRVEPGGPPTIYHFCDVYSE